MLHEIYKNARFFLHRLSSRNAPICTGRKNWEPPPARSLARFIRHPRFTYDQIHAEAYINPATNCDWKQGNWTRLTCKGWLLRYAKGWDFFYPFHFSMRILHFILCFRDSCVLTQTKRFGARLYVDSRSCGLWSFHKFYTKNDTYLFDTREHIDDDKLPWWLVYCLTLLERVYIIALQGGSKRPDSQ